MVRVRVRWLGLSSEVTGFDGPAFFYPSFNGLTFDGPSSNGPVPVLMVLVDGITRLMQVKTPPPGNSQKGHLPTKVKPLNPQFREGRGGKRDGRGVITI